MVFIPLPDPSDPDYFDKLYDILPEVRPPLPEDYYIIDLTDDSYGDRGFRKADADLEYLETFHRDPPPPPHKPIQLTIDEDPDEQPPFAEMELIQSYKVHSFPLSGPPMRKYHRHQRPEVDLTAVINHACVESQLDDSRDAYLRLYKYSCFQEIEEEERKVQECLERVCHLEEFVRKYERARNPNEWVPSWVEERMKELADKREMYKDLLSAI